MTIYTSIHDPGLEKRFQLFEPPVVKFKPSDYDKKNKTFTIIDKELTLKIKYHWLRYGEIYPTIVLESPSGNRVEFGNGGMNIKGYGYHNKDYNLKIQY